MANRLAAARSKAKQQSQKAAQVRGVGAAQRLLLVVAMAVLAPLHGHLHCLIESCCRRCRLP